MALTETEKRLDKKEKPLTKVIIRRLPPTMTKEQFLNQVSPIPDYNYIYHVKGDMSLGENAFSRAYINFVCPEDVYSFKEKFDNYVFVDNKGHEYTAVVEFAPFQKIPKKRGKTRMDPKCNTIESDTYYLEFVANLNKPVEQNAKPEYTLQLNERSDEKKKDMTTPLLEFIKSKRAQKLKIREVRREERERRKKEFERRKEHGKYEGKYYEEKKYDDKSPAKVYGKKSHIKSPKNEASKEQTKAENSEEKLSKGTKEKRDEKPPEKQSPEIKPKEKKLEERKEKKEIKPRFPKKEYSDVRDYKREDYSYRDYRSKHYDEYKKEDSKVYPKKIKKYSEKREERKMEAQKAEQKKLEQQLKEKDAQPHADSDDDRNVTKVNTIANSEKEVLSLKSKQNDEEESKESSSATKQYSSEKETENEGRKKDIDEKSDAGSSSSKRIRNKDRPTIPLYRPGMLSKRKHTDDDQKPEGKTEPKKE